MKIQKPTLFILGTASVLLVAVIGLPDKTSKEIVSVLGELASEAQDPGSSGFTLADEQRQAQRQRSDSLTWERDPFAPITATTPYEEPSAPISTDAAVPFTLTLPHLSGISSAGDSTLALLDGNLVRAGDRLPCGYTVKAIDRRTVTLSSGARLEILTLGSDR